VTKSNSVPVAALKKVEYSAGKSTTPKPGREQKDCSMIFRGPGRFLFPDLFSNVLFEQSLRFASDQKKTSTLGVCLQLL